MTKQRTPHRLAAAFAPALALALGLVAIPRAARASAQTQKEELDRSITAELAARDPEGAVMFTRASQALDRDELDTAADLFERVRQRDPWFSHATRRLGSAESARGHADRSLVLGREAFAADPSALNEAFLAG